MKHVLILLLATAIVGCSNSNEKKDADSSERKSSETGIVQMQQVPIPTSAKEVAGPATGNTMTKAYVQAIGQIAYVWGWPLVNMTNRFKMYSQITEP